MQPTERKRLLTSREVAKELGIAERSVWKWTAAGELPKPVHMGGVTRWFTKEIDDWLVARAAERQTRHGTPSRNSSLKSKG
jgi:predicted DNA-binding transcriptional regulator AlpA